MAVITTCSTGTRATATRRDPLNPLELKIVLTHPLDLLRLDQDHVKSPYAFTGGAAVPEARPAGREFVQFLQIALGSPADWNRKRNRQTHRLPTPEALRELQQTTDHVKAMLYCLVTRIKVR